MNEVKCYLSDRIGEVYKNWLERANSFFVFLLAACGSGKTRFIVYVLLPYAIMLGKKVCILVPRTTLYMKYKADIVDMQVKMHLNVELVESHVMLLTYQGLGKRLQAGGKCPVADATIVEEASSFYDDSSYDETRMLVYRWLIGEGKSNLNIWVSGTGERIFTKVKNDLGLRRKEAMVPGMRFNMLSNCGYHNTYTDYNISADNSWMNVHYVEEVDPVELVSLYPEEKWVFYLESKHEQAVYAEALKKAGYTVAVLNADNISTEQGQETATSIASLDKFKQQILLTTAVVEAGNELKDHELTNQVVLRTLESPFVQSCNRRRKQSDSDKVNLYIAKRDKKFFEKRLEWTMERLRVYLEDVCFQVDRPTRALKKLAALKAEKRDMFLGFFEADETDMIRDELLLEELIYQRDFYKKMAARIAEDEHAYVKEQLKWLGLEETFHLAAYVSENVREQAKRKILCLVKEMEEQKVPCSHEDASKFAKSLLPYAKQIDKQLIGDSMALPKFEKLCQKHHIPCGYKVIPEKKVNYYYFQTWEEKTEPLDDVENAELIRKY